MNGDPHDWEERYRSGEMPWEKGYAAPPLTEYLARCRIEGRVLAPGCGSGHDVRALAAQGAEVVGMDIAPSAIRLARAHAPAGTEAYIEGDWFAPPVEWSGAFDWVVEHTCFCAIDPVRRPDYVRSAAHVLRAGGRLFGIFYRDPGPRDYVGPPYGVSGAELDALFGRAFRAVEEWEPASAYPGREGRELVRILERV